MNNDLVCGCKEAAALIPLMATPTVTALSQNGGVVISNSVVVTRQRQFS